MQQVSQFNLNLNDSLFSHKGEEKNLKKFSSAINFMHHLLFDTFFPFRIPLEKCLNDDCGLRVEEKGGGQKGLNLVIKSCTHKTFDLWLCNFVIHSFFLPLILFQALLPHGSFLEGKKCG